METLTIDELAFVIGGKYSAPLQSGSIKLSLVSPNAKSHMKRTLMIYIVPPCLLVLRWFST